MTKISVVIPTYCRSQMLNRCLDALSRQEVPIGSYEVLVVDNAGDRRTHEVVVWWNRHSEMNTRYVPGWSRKGPAAARNEGWRLASGEIIAFTDDDCVPLPTWLCSIMGSVEDGADAGWGRLIMALPDRPTDYQLDAARLAEAEFVTANCWCTRKALELAGGFDERFTEAWREDSDLYFSLLSHDVRVSHVLEAAVLHPIRRGFWGISIIQQKKGLFDVLLKQKHPALFRSKIGGMPRDYPVSVALLFLTLLGVSAGRKRLAAAAGVGWIGLTVRFCLRRLQRTVPSPLHVAEMAVTSAVIPFLSIYWYLRGWAKFGMDGRGNWLRRNPNHKAIGVNPISRRDTLDQQTNLPNTTADYSCN